MKHEDTSVSRRTVLLGASAALLLPAGATQAQAGQKIAGVVELYTSQGCSSCPPADAVLEKLASRDDVLALSFHVDYWDYLGWKDTLASPENTARQYEYRKAMKNRSVYTPQAVVNGVSHFNGGDHRKITSTISQTSSNLSADIEVQQQGSRIRIDIGDANEKTDAQIMIVYFKDKSTIDIARGENHGRTITYTNSVRGFKTVGMWKGTATSLEMPVDELAKTGADGCAVIIQKMTRSGHPSTIIGAAMLPRQSS